MVLATRVRIGEAISWHMPENSLNRYTFFAYWNYRHARGSFTQNLPHPGNLKSGIKGELYLCKGLRQDYNVEVVV